MGRLQFKTRTMLLLISIFSIGIGFVMYHRHHGLDRLVEELRRIEAELFFEDEAVVWQAGQEVRIPNSSDSAWARLLGKSTVPLQRIAFHESSMHNHWTPNTGVHFDSRLCRRLSQNLATHSIEKLGFYQNTFDSDSDLFFADWQSLRCLEFRDTALPQHWIASLSDLKTLEEVVISGSRCNLDPQHFQGCENLRLIRLANRGVNRNQLDELRKEMPGVQIQLLGGFDSAWTYSADQALSDHDTEAHVEMKVLVERMHAIFAKFDPPVEMEFNPPASQAQLAELERTTGIPLPKYVRALLEIQNGQSSKQFEPPRWLSCQEMIKQYKERLDLNDWDPYYYDFDPLYDFCTNPNYLPIAEGMGVSLVDGSLAGIDDQDGPWGTGRIKNMKQLFKEYLEFLESQRATADSGAEAQKGLLLLGADFWMYDL